MSDFDSIIADMLGSVQEVAGISVVYWRGESSVPLDGVVPGQTDFGTIETDGVAAQYRTRDFIIVASDLVIDAGQVLPKRGDQIKETVGSKTHVYEVGRPEGTDQPWRYSDRGRSRVRVHTKLKEIVDS